jgi:hypothetical protein
VSVVVAVKPSARKRNAKVGRLVFEDGSRHAFESRAAAERWANDLSAGDGHVWVASAHPRDGDDADLYLVSRGNQRENLRPPTTSAGGDSAAIPPQSRNCWAGNRR